MALSIDIISAGARGLDYNWFKNHLSTKTYRLVIFYGILWRCTPRVSTGAVIFIVYIILLNQGRLSEF